MCAAWMPRDVPCTVKQALRIRPTSYVRYATYCTDWSGLVNGQACAAPRIIQAVPRWNGFEIDRRKICCVNSVTLLIRKPVAV